MSVVALVCAVTFAACVPPAPAHHHPRRHPQLLALHAEPDPVAGGRIVDAAGREVLLRGVNVNALVDYWAYGSLPTTFPLTDADMDAIAAVGWNAVRLLVSWSRVEPSPGHYDERYLDRVARAVDGLSRRGVYSIVDFHQDAWGPSLAAPPGTVCPAGADPAFGWDGAPAWATLDGGAARCVPAGIRELSGAVVASFAAFWSDAPGPGGVGIRTRYTDMLQHVARRFARVTAVAGYDVMNEPNAFGSAQIDALGSFYGDAVAAIRAGERDGRGFSHLVLFEPSITWSDVPIGTPPDFPHDDDVVFAPHIYRGGLSSGPIQRDDFVRARADAATFGGAPVFVGEWGASPDRADDANDVYFRRHQQLQDEFRFSATLWTWRESCGDPHKAGDARAGRVPYVWGEFDLDCATNTVRGPRASLVDQLRHPYVRAAPGRLVASTFDETSGRLDVAGAGARPGGRLVVWLPGAVTTDRVHATNVHAVRARTSGTGTVVSGRVTSPQWSLGIDAA
jgi:endoglycosylceramidase